MTVYLVSCVAKKAVASVPARDLYRTWFKKARAWVEARLAPGDRWLILSAKHGLLSPDAVTAPYDVTLPGGWPANRVTWADGVARQVAAELMPGERVVALAGRRYCEPMLSFVRQARPDVELLRPMEGLGIGEQLGFLTRTRLPDL